MIIVLFYTHHHTHILSETEPIQMVGFSLIGNFALHSISFIQCPMAITFIRFVIKAILSLDLVGRGLFGNTKIWGHVGRGTSFKFKFGHES